MKKFSIALLTLLMYVEVSAQVVIKSNPSPTLTDRGMYGESEKISEIVLPATVDYKAPKVDTKLSYIPSDSRTIDLHFLSKATSEIIGNNIIYRQKIVGLDATSVKVYFDRLKLSQNARMFIYTPSGSVVTGPITSAENIEKERIWGSNRFQASSVVIELLIPINEKNENDIHISNITLGVDLKKFSSPTDPASFGNWDNADNCAKFFHIMCTNEWALERKAICLIEGEGYTSSGAMISNTCNANKPYILTAKHNIEGLNTNNLQYYFGWWSTICGDSYNQTALMFNGANLRATYEPTDLALLELINPPFASHDIAYLGWSRSTNLATNSTAIHHPGGDHMRIAITDKIAAIDNIRGYTGTGWKIRWNGSGSTQPGSSGSPLFDHNTKKVIGQLWTGNSSETVCNLKYSLYGRFDLSWIGGGTNETGLKHWLDPMATNDMTTNTTHVSNLLSINPSSYNIDGPSQFCTSQPYSIPNLPIGATVQWYISNAPFLNYSQSNNILTVNRTGDGNAVIDATINICGTIFGKHKNIRVGGDPISMTAEQTNCDEVSFNVTGALAGATYNWSSSDNSILYNGTSTTASTTSSYINAIATNGIAIVNTTNSCSQAGFAVLYYFPYTRTIEGLLPEYSSCGEHLSVWVNITPYDTYYRWFVNDILVKQGPYAGSYCTCYYEGYDARQGGNNTIRVEVETSCNAPINSGGHGEFFWMCGYYRNQDVELFPNPAKNQVTIRLKQNKEKNRANKLQNIREIKITDQTGNLKSAAKFSSNSNSVNVDVSNLSTGIYYVEISDGISKTVLPLNILK